MTTTTRRTARFTKSTEPTKLAELLRTPVAAPIVEEPKKGRGYVAVNFVFDARTDIVPMTANKDMVITGEHGASVSLKAGEKFYAVRAASLGENMWYIVRSMSGQKKCSCPANKPCKHEIAVRSLAPRAKIAAQVVDLEVVNEPKPVYRLITVPGAKESRDLVGEISEIKARKHPEDLGSRGNLGGTKPFSIFR